VIHVCCDLIGGEIGKIYRVSEVARFDREYWCKDCGGYLADPVILALGDVTDDQCDECFPVQWLKKIPPLSELERTEDLLEA
jgi:hypothetical protein